MTEATPAEPDVAVLSPAAPAIKGGAVVGGYAPVVALATWTVNTEDKTATAPLLGGTATVFRRPDGGLSGSWESGDQNIALKFPMNDVKSVAQGQLRCEALIRETLAKTHPQVLVSLTAAEQGEQTDSAAQAPDPF